MNREPRDRLYRLIRIHQMLLRRTPGLTARLMAERFGVDTRTIRRDLKLLRESLGAPIEFERDKGLYRYREPFQMLPELFLNDREVHILLAYRSLHQGVGPVRKMLDRLLRGVARVEPTTVSYWRDRLLREVTVEPPEPS